MLDPKNRNNVQCNISKEFIEALLQLTKLQKDRVIVIKQCDKDAGLGILNFDEYMNAAEDRRTETMEDEEGNAKPYYREVTEAHRALVG